MRHNRRYRPLSISGDFPIFAVRINDDIDLGIAREALRAQEYLRSRGVTADLVIINERASSYAQDMQHTLDAMAENLRLRGLADGPRQHIFAVRRDIMEPQTVWTALLSASRAVFHARNGKISDQITRAENLLAKPLPKEDIPTGPLLAVIPGGQCRDHRDQRRWVGFLERLWRFLRRRPRICHPPARRRSDAAALDQRHFNEAFGFRMSLPKGPPSPGAAIRATIS